MPLKNFCPRATVASAHASLNRSCSVVELFQALVLCFYQLQAAAVVVGRSAAESSNGGCEAQAAVFQLASLGAVVAHGVGLQRAVLRLVVFGEPSSGIQRRFRRYATLGSGGAVAAADALAAPRPARLRLRKQARPRRRAPRPRRGQELHAALRRGAGVRRARRALPGLQAVLPRRGHADAGVPVDGGARGVGRRHRRVAPRALARRHPGRRAHARLRARRHALAAEARRPGRVRSPRFRAPTRARRRRTRRSSTAPTCRS